MHRDLKPANIKLGTEGAVKVLDFGLAKAAHNTFGGDAAASPTVTMGATEAGVILGTAAYMAPEQASGRPVDRRADIWSFGVVLWEMLSGRRLFDGETVSHTLADVLRAGIDFARLPPATPAPVRDLLRRCLDRNVRTRLQSIGEARIALQAFLADPSAAAPIAAVGGAPRHSGRRLLPWLVAAGATAAMLSLAVVHLREEAAPVDPYRFEIPQPSDVVLATFDRPMISPDGRTLAFAGTNKGKRQLFIRRMDSLQTTAIAGTDGAAAPFWSPDSRYIGFGADGKLKKVEAGGGPVQVLCDSPRASAGAWSRDGVIVFGPAASQPLHQVSAAGGTPLPVLKLDESRKERAQLFPHFLPDGRHYLFTSLSYDAGKSGIYLGALGSSDTRLLVNGESIAIFVPPRSLLFGRGQVLMSQPFDPASLQLSGEAVPLVDAIARSFLGSISHSYSSSDNGVLVYRPEAPRNTELVWYDRQGKRLRTAGEPRRYLQFTLSPDHKRIAIQITDPRVGTADIWVLDLVSGILSRMTTDPAEEDGATWSPDGREILYSSSRLGRSNLYRKLVGGGDEQVIYTSDESSFAEAWSGDGSYLFVNQNGRSFYRLASASGATPEPLLTTEYFKDEPRLSPDGRWVAYNTDESGRWEVYIAAFPAFTDRRQVSSSGGVQGFWRQDGRELFYLSLDGTMMSVPISPGPTLDAGVPQVLFPTRVQTSATSDQYAVTGNGQRFLLLEPVETGQRPFVVIVNWPAVLKH